MDFSLAEVPLLGDLVGGLTGGLGADSFVVRGSEYVVDGGVGIDTISYARIGDGIWVDLIRGTDSLGSSIYRVENVVGTASRDTLSGSASANVLDGGGGNDQLIGGGGNDVIVGGVGADLIEGNDGDDVLGDNDIFLSGGVASATMVSSAENMSVEITSARAWR